MHLLLFLSLDWLIFCHMIISYINSLGFFIYEGPTLKTLDFTIRVGSTPTISYFNLRICMYVCIIILDYFIFPSDSVACLAALQRPGECLALLNKRLNVEKENADLLIMRARLHQLFRNVSH